MSKWAQGFEAFAGIRTSAEVRTPEPPVTLRDLIVVREYADALEELAATDRAYGRRNKLVWGELGVLNNSTIATRLLFAGVKVAIDGGVEPLFREHILALGLPFAWRPRTLRAKIGRWGFDMLVRLPIFKDCDGLLELTIPQVLREKIERALAREATSFKPLGQSPPDWTAFRQGGVQLVEAHPDIEAAIAKEIDEGHMPDALAAINYLQSVPFKINTFILDGLRPERGAFRFCGDRQARHRAGFCF